jgi:hypothetical protein
MAKAKGLNSLQIKTLDKLYPEGWTIAHWMYPDTILDRDHPHLSQHDNPNLFGGAHYVVNGEHIILSRRGKYMGYYAWGGRQIPLKGQYKAWGAIVKSPDFAGHYDDDKIAPNNQIIRIR